MSLKAKIEAVIYAAEEPITLEQLASIFAQELPQPVENAGDEHGGESPERSAESPERSAESLIEQGFIEVFSAPDDDQMAAMAALTDSPISDSPVPEVNAYPEVELDPSAAVAEAKKAARLRDRETRLRLKVVVDELIADYASSDRGMEIREVAGGYRIATKPEYHDAVRAFVKSLKPPMKLSLQALETLAVIAYKQPVTAPEVGEIRGVDSSGVLGGLIGRKLVSTAGRKQVIGRPILYKTTREFLLRFGLKDLNELPSIEEFEKLAGDIEISEDEQNGTSTADLPFEETSADVEAAATEEGAASKATTSSASWVGGADSQKTAQANHLVEPVEELVERDGRNS